jgi:two-component system OmpR family response regulator
MRVLTCGLKQSCLITGLDMRVLLLEDDWNLAQGLKAFLEAEGHVVDCCSRLLEALSLANEPYDAYLIDWQLPDGSGLDWVRRLRREGTPVPVIVLTARDLTADRVQGLDAGADDYIVKPFDPEELSARLRAVTRRSAGLNAPRQRFGDVEVDLHTRTVYLHGSTVAVTNREWAILEALVRRPGRLVAKSDLESLVHGLDGEVASNALEVHISALRRKLGRQRIETMRGMGYRVVP